MEGFPIILPITIFSLVVLVILIRMYRWWVKRNWMTSAQNDAIALGEVISETFLVTSCSRCQELEMSYIEVSPNARSVEYLCEHCGKIMRAVAVSDRSNEAIELQESLDATLDALFLKYPALEESFKVDKSFEVPKLPLPYEQGLREPISEAVRGEVWRRDNGICVKCGENKNLEFDHIIPVSKGGATSVRNLQLLCRSCNRSKGARI